MPDGEEGGADEARRVPNRMPDPVGEVVTAQDDVDARHRQVGTSSTPFGILSPGLGSETLETRPQSAIDAVLQTQAETVTPPPPPSRLSPHVETHSVLGDDRLMAVGEIFFLNAFSNTYLEFGPPDDTDGDETQFSVTATLGSLSFGVSKARRIVDQTKSSIPDAAIWDPVGVSLEYNVMIAAEPDMDTLAINHLNLHNHDIYDVRKLRFVDTDSSAGGTVGLQERGDASGSILEVVSMLEVQAYTNVVYRRIRFADPVGNDDGTTKRYVDSLVGGVSNAPFVTLGLHAGLSAETSILEADETELPDDDIHWEWNRANDRLFIIDNIGAGDAQLRLPSQGSAGGILIGGDVVLYRGASNKLYLGTGDSLRLVSGTLEVDTIAEVASGGGVTIDGQLIKDGSVVMSRIGASTFSTLQDMHNVFHSAGWISGGVISDAGGANVDIAAGTGLIRTSDSQTAELQFFDWAANTGNAIPSDTIRYIGVEYNAGSPQVVVRTTENWNATTDFELGIVINEGGTLHIFQHRFEVGDHASSMIERLHGVAYVARDNFVGGIILGESGTNKVTLTAGTLWSGLTEYPISALDTNVAGSFDRYYRNSPSGFVKEAAQTDWPNTQYDDGSGSLVVMTNNRYAVLWFYVETDDEVIMLYGRNQYVTAALAENEAVPATVPDRIAAHGLLIGKLIFQKSAASATEISSVFTATFTHLGVTSHADLASVTSDQHHVSFVQADADLLYDVLGGLASHTALDTGVHGAGGDVLATDADITTHAGVTGAHHTLLHAAAQHNAATLPGTANENLGAFYLDIDDIAAPANPGAGIRRLFTDTATGELSVRTSAGTTVSLEGALSGHDHTGAADGGVLTNDEHDGFSEYDEISAPSIPAANKGRLYVRSFSNQAQLFYIDESGYDHLLAVPWENVDLGDDWALAVTGSGVAGAQASRRININSGGTAGSTAYLQTQGVVGVSTGVDGQVVDWSQRVLITLKFAIRANTSSGVVRFTLGKTASDGMGTLNNRGVGLQIEQLALKGHVHDGSSATTTGTLSTLTQNQAYRLLVVSDGAGNIEWFLDGTSIGTSAAGPSAAGAVGDCVFQADVANGVNSAVQAFEMYALQVAAW